MYVSCRAHDHIIAYVLPWTLILADTVDIGQLGAIGRAVWLERYKFICATFERTAVSSFYHVTMTLARALGGLCS